MQSSLPQIGLDWFKPDPPTARETKKKWSIPFPFSQIISNGNQDIIVPVNVIMMDRAPERAVWKSFKKES